MRLPDSLRDRLRAPLGELIPDRDVPGAVAGRVAGAYVVSVGDRTTERLASVGIVPSLQIVDGLERRRGREPPPAGGAREIRVENPPAQVTEGSVEAIRAAYAMEPPVRILVSGEEDLLVLPACVHAPEGAAVLYGQPGEGMVVVRVTPQVRNKTAALLGLME